MAKQAKVTAEMAPSFSIIGLDFINGLLQRKAEVRLGSDKPGSAKNHDWFQGFDWKAVEDKRMVSPMKGFTLGDENLNGNDEYDDPAEKSLFERNVQIQKMFGNYYFDGGQKKEKASLVTKSSTTFSEKKEDNVV